MTIVNSRSKKISLIMIGLNLKEVNACFSYVYFQLSKQFVLASQLGIKKISRKNQHLIKEDFEEVFSQDSSFTR